MGKMPDDSFLNTHSRVRVLGVGGQGRAELWANRQTGALVVAKIVDSHGEKTGDTSIVREAKIHSRLSFSKIVQFLGCDVDKPKFGEARIVMEYCDKGDLFKFRRFAERNKHAVPERFIWSVFTQLSEAVAYLHNGHGSKSSMTGEWEAILHCDIKPENVFLKNIPGKDLPLVKLGDFGLSMLETCADETSFLHGTPQWYPPELSLSRATDIWGIGAVIYFLATGQCPVDFGASPPSRIKGGSKLKAILSRGRNQVKLSADQTERVQGPENGNLPAMSETDQNVVNEHLSIIAEIDADPEQDEELEDGEILDKKEGLDADGKLNKMEEYTDFESLPGYLKSYSLARFAPRLVVPINIDFNGRLDIAGVPVSRTWDQPYSDSLNYWMNLCLKSDPKERVDVLWLVTVMNTLWGSDATS